MNAYTLTFFSRFLYSQRFRKIKHFFWTALLALSTGLVVLQGCFRNPVTHRREARLISEAAERQIGLETQKRLKEEYGEFQDPVLREYVSSLGQRLVAVSDRSRLPFEFTILDTEMVNAFAVPGGFIFVTRGILDELMSEAELATVLGHEIAHVCAWHSVNMIEKQMGYGALSTLGAIVSGIQLGPEAMIMVAQTADLFTTLYLLGYSREYEMEADRVGLRYAISAGYAPEAALDFFERLRRMEEQEGLDKWESFFRSHPPTQKRIQQAGEYVSRFGGRHRKVTDGFEIYQELKNRLPHIRSEERGRFQGNDFFHPEWGIRMSIPEGWKWDAQSRHSLAAFRSSNGEGWGELRRQRLGKGVSVRDYAQRFSTEKQWSFFQAKPVLYPAGYGLLARYRGAGVLGGLFEFRVLFTVQNDIGYALICASPPDKMARYLILFEQIQRSFRLE